MQLDKNIAAAGVSECSNGTFPSPGRRGVYINSPVLVPPKNPICGEVHTYLVNLEWFEVAHIILYPVLTVFSIKAFRREMFDKRSGAHESRIISVWMIPRAFEEEYCDETFCSPIMLKVCKGYLSKLTFCIAYTAMKEPEVMSKFMRSQRDSLTNLFCVPRDGATNICRTNKVIEGCRLGKADYEVVNSPCTSCSKFTIDRLLTKGLVR